MYSDLLRDITAARQHLDWKSDYIIVSPCYTR